MAIRKPKANLDPVADLETKIENLGTQLQKARSKKLDDAEKAVAKAVKNQAAAAKKLDMARSKQRAAKAALKSKKSAAAISRVENCKQLLAAQKEALDSCKVVVATAKTELATLKQSYKMAMAVTRAAARAEAEINKTAAKKSAPKKVKKAPTVKKQRVKRALKALSVANRTAVQGSDAEARLTEAAEATSTPSAGTASPSLFGDD